MEQLGIDPKLLLAQVINFLIIVVVLTKILYRPILTMLERRRREITAGLELTEKMRQEEEKLGQKREKILEAARHEGQMLIEEAKKQAREAEKEIVADSHKEAEDILARAKLEADQLKEKALKDVRGETVTLVVSMARRLLSRILSGKEQHKLIANHIKELEAMAPKSR